MLAGAPFGGFLDSNGYAGYVASGNILRNHVVLSEKSKLLQDFNKRHMGTTACADHCHKPTKLIRANGAAVAVGIYTIMNVWSQIMGQWVVYDQTITGLQEPLEKLQARLEQGQGKVSMQTAGAAVHLLENACKHMHEVCKILEMLQTK